MTDTMSATPLEPALETALETALEPALEPGSKPVQAVCKGESGAFN